jgi:hypothetical protein
MDATQITATNGYEEKRLSKIDDSGGSIVVDMDGHNDFVIMEMFDAPEKGFLVYLEAQYIDQLYEVASEKWAKDEVVMDFQLGHQSIDGMVDYFIDGLVSGITNKIDGKQVEIAENWARQFEMAAKKIRSYMS